VNLKKTIWSISAALAGALVINASPATTRAAEPAAAAPGGEPTTEQLQQKLQQLQSKLQQLESQQQAQQSATQQSATSRATDDTVERVLRDADKRSQLMQLDEGFTAGFNNGRFVIGSADGNFSLMPLLQLQFRNVTNYISGDGDSIENGFEIRRAKFGFDGNAFSKDFYYYFLWATSSTTGGVSLEQAWVRYKALPDANMSVRLGQFVDPAIHEQNVSSKFQLAVERSLMLQILAGTGESFTQGVTALWEPDHFRFEAGFTDGINTGNTDFRDFPTGPTDFGVVGRAEWFAIGDPKQYIKEYNDFTARGDKENLLVFGAGVDWTQAGDTDDLTHTADVQFETESGLTIYGAYLGQYLHNGAGTGITGVTGGAGDTYNWGFLVQAGYVLPNTNVELFGRYDYTHLDNAIAAGIGTEDTFQEITGGVNYFFAGHNAKFTLDLTFLPNGSPGGAGGLDFISSNDDEWVLRGQFQLLL
jgi:hypothetical protein